MVEAIIIVFYKATRNAGLAFNLITTDFFELFYVEILAFLFAMIYYSIREYQSRVKIVKLFDGKIAQNVYCLYNVTHSHGCTNIDNRYVYTDPPAVI